MTEKYPFFREADEQTKAVIGEDAIVADLNGTYQKPYAVLTQKRLYCKNERGNFIVGANKLLGANSVQNPTFQNLLWAVFAIDALNSVLAGIGIMGMIIEISNLLISRAVVIGVGVIDVIAIAICLIAFLLVRKKNPKISLLLLCVATVLEVFGYILLSVAAIVLCVIAATRNKNNERFEVRHSTGTFTFSPKLYPAGELKNFEQQVKSLQAGGANGR